MDVRWGRFKRTGIPVGVCFLLATAAGLMGVTTSAAESPPPADSHDLRGVYYETQTPASMPSRVGRLAVRWVGIGWERRVRIDHPFRTGDRFRFELSANRDGWLYLFHRKRGDPPRLLWPPDNSDQNRIESRKTHVVPEPPGVFAFDDQAGSELFSMVMRSRRGIPQLAAAEDPSPETAAENGPGAGGPDRPNTKIVQIGVRGTDPDQAVAGRTIVFDPGRHDGDPFIYFAAHPEETVDTTVIEFQLQHVK